MELALPETNRQGRYRFHAPWRNLSVCSTFIEYHSFHEGLTLLVLSLFYGLPILVFACGHVPGGRTARTESAPDMTIVVAAYGVARVFHEKGDTARAMEAYQATLDEPADPLAKWHGFARMHLITLYLQTGDISAARRVLEDLEGMESAYDFRSSVENRIRFLPWP